MPDDMAFWRQRWMRAAGQVGFLLLPQFSMLELFCAVDPLRIASRLGGGGFGWTLFSVDGGPVLSSNGTEISVDARFGDGPMPGVLFVVASYDPLLCVTVEMEHALRRMARHGVLLGAVDTGTFVLARAHLLSGRRVTLHWESSAAFTASFPDVEVTPNLYEFDRDRLTCAGGSAVIDMILFFIGLQGNADLLRSVAEQVIHPPMRPGAMTQRLAPRTRYALHDRRLVRAVELMERTIEHPLPMATIASVAGVSQRQFERLCHQHLKRSGKSFYLALRLERARQMLVDSDLPAADVALAAGFDNAAHFSRLFRRVFGCSPTAMRRAGAASAPEPIRTENNRGTKKGRMPGPDRTR
ncbi:GlxA family transcriptional regulator [Komagataeibacter sp. FNDCF1]|uniref:GlxA family transcriptional regulator n=1 Tax=Komagataeibacter sp. FNDCF1 TaxID=2878681 RepID=UPI001E2D93D0|nr:GlxA family transcriptional regulator [Komagataeibacter sp. FNDCF1]MCE2565122.1 GlxA family transcriptional regulator [Komagataeibacter sp. FNDCF1]